MSDDILNGLGGLLKNEKIMKKLSLRLSEADKQKIASLAKNPALLKAIISDPKAKEQIAKFLGGIKE